MNPGRPIHALASDFSGPRICGPRPPPSAKTPTRRSTRRPPVAQPGDDRGVSGPDGAQLMHYIRSGDQPTRLCINRCAAMGLTTPTTCSQRVQHVIDSPHVAFHRTNEQPLTPNTGQMTTALTASQRGVQPIQLLTNRSALLAQQRTEVLHLLNVRVCSHVTSAPLLPRPPEVNTRPNSNMTKLCKTVIGQRREGPLAAIPVTRSSARISVPPGARSRRTLASTSTGRN